MTQVASSLTGSRLIQLFFGLTIRMTSLDRSAVTPALNVLGPATGKRYQSDTRDEERESSRCSPPDVGSGRGQHAP